MNVLDIKLDFQDNIKNIFKKVNEWSITETATLITKMAFTYNL